MKHDRDHNTDLVGKDYKRKPANPLPGLIGELLTCAIVLGFIAWVILGFPGIPA